MQPQDTQSSHAEAQEPKVGVVSVAKGDAVWEAIAAIFLISHTENNPNVYQPENSCANGILYSSENKTMCNMIDSHKYNVELRKLGIRKLYSMIYLYT